MAESNDIQVFNNEAESRFEAKVDGKLAVAEYEKNRNVITFTHTEVPEELGGRGIAQRLATTGLDYAREHKLRVVPQCRYIAGFIAKHPEYQDLVG